MDRVFRRDASEAVIIVKLCWIIIVTLVVGIVLLEIDLCIKV